MGMIQNSAKGSFDLGDIKQEHRDHQNREDNKTTCFSCRQEQRHSWREMDPLDYI